MAVINTTDIINSSIIMKAKLPKNMVSDNYYIENLQNKRNLDWEMRYNVVGIEQEEHLDVSYTSSMPTYKPIDVVIRSVKGERGVDLGVDWAELSFKDLKYPNGLGDRFRFNLDFPDMSTMTEEQKHYDTSVWLTTNKSPISPGNSCVTRRCNCNIALVGSYNSSYDSIIETRYEPGVLDNENKYVNVYTNMVLSVPQAEYYITLQLNYFTNHIKIGNRIMIGGVDLLDAQNNTIFKVKSVAKVGSQKTFSRDGDDCLGEIPLLVIGLDKDINASDGKDDYEKKVAFNAPIYPIPVLTPEKEIIPETNFDNTIPLYYTVMDDGAVIMPDSVINIVQGDTVKCHFSSPATCSYVFEGIIQENWPNYFEFVSNAEEKWFSVKNLKMSRKGTLKVTVTYSSEENISNTYLFKLGGFY